MNREREDTFPVAFKKGRPTVELPMGRGKVEGQEPILPMSMGGSKEVIMTTVFSGRKNPVLGE